MGRNVRAEESRAEMVLGRGVPEPSVSRSLKPLRTLYGPQRDSYRKMSDRLKELRERSQKRKQLLAQAVNEAKFRTFQYFSIDCFFILLKCKIVRKTAA